MSTSIVMNGPAIPNAVGSDHPFYGLLQVLAWVGRLSWRWFETRAERVAHIAQPTPSFSKPRFAR